jgi:carboxyl-terminal processing protease
LVRFPWFASTRFACILLLVVAVAAATARPAHRPAGSAALDSLSPRDRLKVFEEVWHTIDEKYYDPRFKGVNWKAVHDRYSPLIENVTSDADFYGLLKKMVGELHDAHTRFHTPRERRERKKQQAVTAGVGIFEVEGRAVVTYVDPNSEASRLGVEAGMVVRSIDGTSIDAWLTANLPRIENSSSERATRLRLYRRISEGEPGTSFKLGLTRADDTTLEVTLVRRVVSDVPVVNWRRLPSGYGYMKLNIWKAPIHKEFDRALERLMDTPGLIMDLRGNPGGEVHQVLEVAEHFFSKRVAFGRFIARSGRSLELFTGDDGDEIYRGAVVILINESSGSGSEMFAGVLQENGRATVIGRQSCGCLLGIAKFREVEGGGELAVSELAYESPKGKTLEGRGVIPNEQIALTIVDLQRRRDATLEAAENALKAPLKTSTVVR